MGDVVEDYRSIDVRRWRREGLLRPGRRFGWSWFQGEKRESSIGVEVMAEAVRLSYVWDRGTPREREIRYKVGIARTPCHFGGTRPWFVCPGRGCRRRVTTLYLLGAYFLCRHCQGLGYEEARPHRLLRRAQRVRQRLGGPTGLSYPFPPRPKGMWRRTYDRLRWHVFEAEMAADDEIHARLARACTWLDRTRPSTTRRHW